jgi:hypothetical protein
MVLSAGVALCLTGAPVARADVTPDQLAQATFDQIVAGDYAGATTQFDQNLQKMLPAAALGQAWSAYQQTFGAYQSHGDPEDVQRGDLTVVNLPLQMARRPGQFRLTVHPDGTVAGLYFLREGVPVP